MKDVMRSYGRIDLRIEILPRKWPCFAVGWVASGREFVLHLWLVCFTLRY